MPRSEEQKFIRQLMENKPEGFGTDREWAEFQLAALQTLQQRSFFRRAAGFATTLTAIIGVLTAAVTTWQLSTSAQAQEEERKARERVEYVKLYVSSIDEFSKKEHCSKFTAFGYAVKGVDAQLWDEIYKGYSDTCRSEVGDSKASAGVARQEGGEIIVRNDPASSYSVLQQLSVSTLQLPQEQPVSLQDLTVFIQYPAGRELEVEEVRRLVAAEGGRLPGAEQVRSVPDFTQIRIYKDSQHDAVQALARALTQMMGREVPVISLQKAYPKLPDDRLEVWIGSGHTEAIVR